MGNAKVNLLVVPGKNLAAAQFPAIRKALSGKSFPLAMQDKELTAANAVSDRAETAERIVDLLLAKAPELKNAQKVIVQTSQFKTVPDDCAVVMKIDGDKDKDIQSTVKLDKPRQGDPTKRAGYKPVVVNLTNELDGPEVYNKADLKDLLICPNPGIEVSVRLSGPEMEAASNTHFRKVVADALGVTATKLGALVDKSVDQLKKLVDKKGDVDGAEIRKITDALAKGASVEISRLQPSIVKGINDAKNVLKGKDPDVAALDFDCSVVARFVKFHMSPDLVEASDAGTKGGGKDVGPSKNDKQVRPLTRERKESLVPLKRDASERKKCVNAIRPFLRALAYEGEGDAKALADKAEAGQAAFMDFLEELTDSLEDMNQTLERIAKNAKLEKPSTKDSKDEQAQYKDILVDFRNLKKLLNQRLDKGEAAAKCMSDVEDLIAAAKAGDKVEGRAASQIGRKLELVLKHACTTREMSRFKLLSQNVLDFIG